MAVFPVGIRAPLLSEYDPEENTESAIYPLGTYPISDALADALAPGMTERQSNPRFPTLMALWLEAGRDITDIEVAKDGHSEPWQVYEWIVVESLVRAYRGDSRMMGLAGREKTETSVRRGEHLNRRNYLVMPSVFGFHGIYRVLSRAVGVEQGDQLGEAGYELAKCWETDRNMSGFINSTDGEGAVFRRELVRCVRDGLRTGEAVLNPHVEKVIAEHLNHWTWGSREKEAIAKLIAGGGKGCRGELWGYILKKAWVGHLDIKEPNEMAFHESILPSASPDLSDFLKVIFAYERFIKVIHDVFEDILRFLTLSSGKHSAREIAEGIPEVVADAKGLPGLYRKAFEGLATRRMEVEFVGRFDPFERVMKPAELVKSVLDLHLDVQRKKVPSRAPWVEVYQDDEYAVRPDYKRESGRRPADRYVYFYRSLPLLNFARNMGLVDGDK